MGKQLEKASTRGTESGKVDSAKNSKQVNEQTSLLNLQLDLQITQPSRGEKDLTTSPRDIDQDKTREQTEIDVDCENTETPMDSLVTPGRNFYVIRDRI